MNRLNRIKEILVIQGKTQTWLADQLGKTKIHSIQLSQ